MTPSGQALLSPHQSLVGDSCGQKTQNSSSWIYLFLQQAWLCSLEVPALGVPEEGQIMGKIRPLASRVFKSDSQPPPWPHPRTKLHSVETEGQGTQGGDWGPRSGWTASRCPPGTDSVTSPDPGVLLQLSLSPSQPASLPLGIPALPRGTLSIPQPCLALPSSTAESLHHGSHPSLPLWHHPSLRRIQRR